MTWCFSCSYSCIFAPITLLTVPSTYLTLTVKLYPGRDKSININIYTYLCSSTLRYHFETYPVLIILFIWNLPCPYHLIFFETYPVLIILFLWNLPCPCHLISLKPTLSLSSYFETYPVPIILFLCFYLFAWTVLKVYRDPAATTIKVVAADLSDDIDMSQLNAKAIEPEP